MVNNITWHKTKINKKDRQIMNSHKSVCLWFTGLSGSGKSTIANEVEAKLHKMKIHTYLLDGDNIRTGLNNDLGFSDSDRTENIRRIGEVVKLFVDAGIIVLAAFISPFEKDRKEIRRKLEEKEFIEIFVDCPFEICESRDPKGLYKKARTDQINNFTGIGSIYERPESPEILINNNDSTEVNVHVSKIIQYLKENNIIEI